MADCVGLVDELDGDDGFRIVDRDCFLDAVIDQSQAVETNLMNVEQLRTMHTPLDRWSWRLCGRATRSGSAAARAANVQS